MANIEDQVVEWRGGVMDKPRRGITRSEYIEQFIELISARVYFAIEDLDKWEVRHAVYYSHGKYRWQDPRWRKISIGDRWGGEGLTGFFRRDFTVPQEFDGKPVSLDIFFGGDGVVRVDGEPFAGLECFHREVLLSESAEAGRTYRLELEISVDHQVTPGPFHEMHYAKAVSIDREVESFYWDFRSAFLAVNNEWADEEVAGMTLQALEQAMLLCDPFTADDAVFRRGMRRARKRLHPMLEKLAAEHDGGALTILGHSHLDLVYLWAFPEFQRKILRTHTTQLMLMKEFPDWKFSQSQAVLYREIKRLYPDLYDGICQRVKEGRWEALGGMFVEPDCNLVSGESLVRQFLYGQRFFQQTIFTPPSWCGMIPISGTHICSGGYPRMVRAF